MDWLGSNGTLHVVVGFGRRRHVQVWWGERHRRMVVVPPSISSTASRNKPDKTYYISFSWFSSLLAVGDGGMWLVVVSGQQRDTISGGQRLVVYFVVDMVVGMIDWVSPIQQS